MPGILGKKIGMTQIFAEDGRVLPVTVIESCPCAVLQIKTTEKDGYNALQLGYGDIKETKLGKPVREKFKKIKVSPKRLIKEIRTTDSKNYQVGQNLDLAIFNPGDYVDITGNSIGRGFQGGVKRWHWRGGAKSHGSMSHRAPGSIGSNTDPGRVWKGHHLPGHMGNQKVTVQNLEVLNVDKDNHLLVVKGSVPGHKNCYLIVKKAKKKKFKLLKKPPEEKKEKPGKSEKKEKPAEGKK